MNINNNLNSLLQTGYGTYNYCETKAKVFTLLELIKKNKSTLSTVDIQKILLMINPIINKLGKIRKAIIKEKLSIGSSSIFNIFKRKLNDFVGMLQKSFYGNYHLKDLIHSRNKIALQTKITNSIHIPSSCYVKPIEKFKTSVRKLQNSIAIGSHVKNTITLEKNYWLETLGMILVIGKATFKGHIYTAYLSSGENYPEKWRVEKDERGFVYQKKYSFEEYLNHVIIPKLTPIEKEEFNKKLSIVEYYTPEQLDSLKAIFDKEGRITTRTPILNTWVDRKASDAKQSYSEFYKTFKLSETAEKHTTLKDQTYMYILDSQGSLYLQIKERGKTNHTSLSNGHAVLAAGSLKVKNGKIIAIDTFSGHYKPTKVQLITLLEFLKKSGVNINEIKLTYVEEYNVQPWIIKDVNPGQVEAWIALNKRSSKGSVPV